MRTHHVQYVQTPLWKYSSIGYEYDTVYLLYPVQSLEYWVVFNEAKSLLRKCSIEKDDAVGLGF